MQQRESHAARRCAASRVRSRDDDHAKGAGARAGRRFDWKPHAKSFSLGALATHVANLPTWGTETLTRSEIDLAGDATPPAAAAVEDRAADAFDRNVADARAAMTGKTDAELMAIWSLKRGRQDALLDAEERGAAVVRPEPPHSSPRTAERVSAAAGRAGSGDLRSERGRTSVLTIEASMNVQIPRLFSLRHSRSQIESASALGILQFSLAGVFLFLATANGAGLPLRRVRPGLLHPGRRPRARSRALSPRCLADRRAGPADDGRRGAGRPRAHDRALARDAVPRRLRGLAASLVWTGLVLIGARVYRQPMGRRCARGGVHDAAPHSADQRQLARAVLPPARCWRSVSACSPSPRSSAAGLARSRPGRRRRRRPHHDGALVCGARGRRAGRPRPALATAGSRRPCGAAVVSDRRGDRRAAARCA